jgi:hypothetical protein
MRAPKCLLALLVCLSGLTGCGGAETSPTAPQPPTAPPTTTPPAPVPPTADRLTVQLESLRTLGGDCDGGLIVEDGPGGEFTFRILLQGTDGRQGTVHQTQDYPASTQAVRVPPAPGQVMPLSASGVMTLSRGSGFLTGRLLVAIEATEWDLRDGARVPDSAMTGRFIAATDHRWDAALSRWTGAGERHTLDLTPSSGCGLSLIYQLTAEPVS